MSGVIAILAVSVLGGIAATYDNAWLIGLCIGLAYGVGLLHD